MGKTLPLELHASMALQAIYRLAFDSDRPVPFFSPTDLAKTSLTDRRRRLEELIHLQQHHRPAIETLIATRETVEIKRSKMGGVLVLDDHGCPVKPQKYGLRNKTMQSLETEFEQVCKVSDANAKLGTTLHRIGGERLATGLSLFFDGSMTLPAERQQVLESKIKCAAGFARIDSALADISRELIIADMALRYESLNNEWIDELVAFPVGRCRALIDKIQSRLCKAPYPFATTRNYTIDEWAVSRGALPHRLTDIRKVSNDIERYRHLISKLHQRVHSHLCAFAYNAEQFLAELPEVTIEEPEDDFELIITDS